MRMEQKKKIFISYGGNIDSKIAILLCDFLIDFLGYKNSVYCTASKDNMVSTPYGDDFSASYMENIREADIFIPLLSGNYLESKTTLVEMGAAFALNKKFIPFLVSGCDYEKVLPLYNIRNNDMYEIDNFAGLKKAIEEINRTLGTFNPTSEDKQRKFINNIKNLKTGNTTNISKKKEVEFICRNIFENIIEYQIFIKELGKKKMIDICITHYYNEKIINCYLYFKSNKNVSDLIYFLDEKGILEKTYIFKAIES